MLEIVQHLFSSRRPVTRSASRAEEDSSVRRPPGSALPAGTGACLEAIAGPSFTAANRGATQRQELYKVNFRAQRRGPSIDEMRSRNAA